jgi:hypothetical protein
MYTARILALDTRRRFTSGRGSDEAEEHTTRMEPRPPKTTRPVTGAPAPVFSPPPVPTSERLAARPAWLDEQPPAATGQARDERGALDVGPSPTIPPSQARAVWFDPAGEPAPGMDQPASPRSPLSPVVAPRGERRARFLGPILAALLLVLVVGGAAFAVDKARDGDDNRDAADATATARTLALASSPVATATTPAEKTEVAETPTTEEQEPPPPTATAEPTQAQAAGAAAAEEASPTPRAASTEPTRSTSLRAPDFLPDLNDLPDGFEQTADDKYSKAEMIEQLGDNGADLVEEWEWRENAYRWFAIPETAEPDPESTSAVTVSVHRFRARAGATDAIDGLAEIVLAAGGYEEVDVEKIGDEARALLSETAEGNTYVLYVRTANFVIRFGGFSVAGDPSETVIDLAKNLVEG